MSSVKATYADILLPLAIRQTYTYLLPVPFSNTAKPGMRVVVQLGPRKLYTGIIYSIHQQQPTHPVKPVLEVLDNEPGVTQQQLSFWDWLSGYYMCSIGEVMNAALPAGLKLASESHIIASSTPPEWDTLSDHEFLLMEALEHQDELSVQDAAKILDLQNPLRIIHKLIDHGMVSLEENIKDTQRAKTFILVSLAQDFTESQLNNHFESLKRAPKQSAVLLAYFKLKGAYRAGLVPQDELLKSASATKSTLNGLVEKGIFNIQESLSPPEGNNNTIQLNLSPAQKKAQIEIKSGFAANKPVLLHGITGSGKTEIYISLLKEALTKHKRALYLVPEIALTTQLIDRLRLHFGEQVIIYHSRISQGERLSAYKRLLSEEKPLLLLGARSALLLPLPDLGLVVIDEEHDPSFKQQDPAPRYHARDSAVVLANFANCPILLGSATPSAESYHNAQSERFLLCTLNERYGGVHLPEMEVVDIRRETLWKTMKGHYSPKLIEEIQQTIAAGKKAILFQNRRGYSPIIQCETCGHTQECPNCDITLTYHKYANKLTCHYCGHTEKTLSACPKCGSTALNEKGFGTEKLEEELQTLLPDVTVARLDFDSTRRKNAFSKIIGQFGAGDIDVLIGTQMVTKGLDFDDVTLVGILSADSMLHYPDFRAQERAFQLMEQVAGRAGRRAERGRVTIQTYRPDHRVIEAVVKHDYEKMIAQQLQEREVFRYPPFVRLIQLELRHRDKNTLDAAAHHFASALVNQLGERVLGPEYPPISRMKNVYRKRILLKLERELSAPKVKAFIWQVHDALILQKPFKGVRVVFDVDPY